MRDIKLDPIDLVVFDIQYVQHPAQRLDENTLRFEGNGEFFVSSVFFDRLERLLSARFGSPVKITQLGSLEAATNHEEGKKEEEGGGSP